MFDKGKNDKNKTNETTTTSASFSASQSSTTKVTTIGQSIKIRGEVAGAEDLIIQGQVEGTINLKSNSLTVGEKGNITATTLAQRVTVKGNVEGDIMATDKITISQTGSVVGNLTAPRVILEDGSRFKGSIDMDSKVGAEKAASAQVTAATASSSKAAAH
ncbi:MAG: bactofilin family protein [bacterium]